MTGGRSREVEESGASAPQGNRSRIPSRRNIQMRLPCQRPKFNRIYHIFQAFVTTRALQTRGEDGPVSSLAQDPALGRIPCF